MPESQFIFFPNFPIPDWEYEYEYEDFRLKNNNVHLNYLHLLELLFLNFPLTKL